MSAFILVLDSSEEVVYDTIVKYIEKFSPKIFTKNLIIINNRATLQNHTMEQFCQVFYDFLNQEYADESMKNDLKIKWERFLNTSFKIAKWPQN